MHFLKNFYFKTLKYDLINKFKYKSSTKLPRFKNIILNVNSKTVNIKQLLSKLLAIELVSQQKGYLFFTKTSKIFKSYINNFIGCKLTIKNNNLFNILEKIITIVFLKPKNLTEHFFYFKIQEANFIYHLKNIFVFSELENNYYFFNNLSRLSVIITLNYFTEKKEFIFVLKSFKFNFPFIVKNQIKKVKKKSII